MNPYNRICFFLLFFIAIISNYESCGQHVSLLENAQSRKSILMNDITYLPMNKITSSVDGEFIFEPTWRDLHIVPTIDYSVESDINGLNQFRIRPQTNRIIKEIVCSYKVGADNLTLLHREKVLIYPDIPKTKLQSQEIWTTSNKVILEHNLDQLAYFYIPPSLHKLVASGGNGVSYSYSVKESKIIFEIVPEITITSPSTFQLPVTLNDMFLLDGNQSLTLGIQIIKII